MRNAGVNFNRYGFVTIFIPIGKIGVIIIIHGSRAVEG